MGRSPVFLTFSNNIQHIRGRGYWKFNNLLLHEKDFVTGIKRIISQTSSSQEFDSPQIKWEVLKFYIAKFSRKFSRVRKQNINKRQIELEKIVNDYEVCGNSDSISKETYDNSKAELEKIIEDASRGAMLRSKAQYIEQGEKPTKFFLNLEKSRGAANMVVLW